MKYTHPSILYKYRSFNDFTILSLINECYFIPTAPMLNDPFDAYFDLSIEKPSYNQVVDCARMTLTMKEYLPFLTRFNRYYKATTSEKREEEKVKRFASELKNESKELGVFSLSSEPNISSMWSLYADSHKGICIGYNVHKLFYESKPTLEDWLRPVRYLPESKIIRNAYLFYYLTFMCNQKINSPFFHERFFQKSLDWKHEREWRVVAPGQGGIAYKLDLHSIESITFGLKMKAESKSAIVNIFNGKAARPTFYHMVRAPNTAQLLRIELSPDSDLFTKTIE